MNATQMRAGVSLMPVGDGTFADITPEARLARARARGQVLNLCPFCGPDGKTDAHGYCRHLIGFAISETHFEPMVRRKGKFVIQVPRSKVTVPKVFDDDDEEQEDGPPEYPRLQANDVKVPVGTQTRIYRNVTAESRKKGT